MEREGERVRGWEEEGEREKSLGNYNVLGWRGVPDCTVFASVVFARHNYCQDVLFGAQPDSDSPWAQVRQGTARHEGKARGQGWFAPLETPYLVCTFSFSPRLSL
ncbi:hypothetical protein E2C01_093980 [Portunus trituberculatus]|uniref:Uncharacterized protein n=1 Tax=Portunus trituberculatus TaxID=210409 RepID=A0A5B7JWC2_PORTR|nr:hypothetical protein [Portunus trituberculatus]